MLGNRMALSSMQSRERRRRRVSRSAGRFCSSCGCVVCSKQKQSPHAFNRFQLAGIDRLSNCFPTKALKSRTQHSSGN
jgi:hypothetical protein